MLYDAHAVPTLRAHSVSNLDDRVKLLRKLVLRGDGGFRGGSEIGGLRDPRMRQIGLAVTEPCKARDDRCELEAIYTFVQRNVRYTGDITFKDTFQSALRTLQYGGGDCDDHSILCAVLAMENGFQTRFRITSNYGDTWDHIFCLAGLPRNSPRFWVALDTTLTDGGRVGKQPPMAKYKDFEVAE